MHEARGVTRSCFGMACPTVLSRTDCDDGGGGGDDDDDDDDDENDEYWARTGRATWCLVPRC